MRAAGALLAGVLLGVPSGAATVLVHTSWWGLALGLAAALTTLRWLSRAPRVGFALGWGLAVSRASLTRPEGDYLVSADAPGWTLVVSSIALVVAAVLGAALRSGRTADRTVRGAPS